MDYGSFYMKNYRKENLALQMSMNPEDWKKEIYVITAELNEVKLIFFRIVSSGVYQYFRSKFHQDLLTSYKNIFMGNL